MPSRVWSSTVIFILVSVTVAALLSLVFSQFITLTAARTIQTSLPAVPPGAAEGMASAGLLYSPPKPEEAPASIREAVLLGARIMADPQKHAGKYVGNALKCSNCHFNGGISQGGKTGASPWSGLRRPTPSTVRGSTRPWTSSRGSTTALSAA